MKRVQHATETLTPQTVGMGVISLLAKCGLTQTILLVEQPSAPAATPAPALPAPAPAPPPAAPALAAPPNAPASPPPNAPTPLSASAPPN